MKRKIVESLGSLCIILGIAIFLTKTVSLNINIYKIISHINVWWLLIIGIVLLNIYKVYVILKNAIKNTYIILNKEVWKIKYCQVLKACQIYLKDTEEPMSGNNENLKTIKNII